MDNTKELRVVEWFTGYGGNELGLRRCIPNMRPIAFCERDAFVVANLVSKMEAGLLDAVPVWTDAKTFPCEPFADGKVDLFIASYPCQGFSHAGKRLGVEDERHLWPYCRAWIKGARPGAVFLENVEGHVTLGLSTVLADLEEDNYRAAWGIFSASEVGAPHQRKRVFILAYDKSERCKLMDNEQGLGGDEEGGHLGRSGPLVAQQQQQGLEGHAGDGDNAAGQTRRGEDRPVAEGGVCGGVVNTASARCDRPEFGPEGQTRNETRMPMPGEGCYWPSRPGVSQYGWEPPRVVLSQRDGGGSDEQGRGSEGRETVGGPGGGEIKSEVGRMPYGPPPGLDLARCTGLSDSELAVVHEIEEWMVRGCNRTDELRMCGNGVVPATAERAFRVLSAELAG